MWFSTSSGRIELQMTLDQALGAYHQGQCDEDVAELCKVPKILRQTRKIDAELLRQELREYGAWDADDLQDHDQNLQRIVWLAAGDIVEQYKEQTPMTMLARYPSKKDLKAAIGQPLKYAETSMFGEEYRDNGTFVVAGRPHLQSYVKREYFATVTMTNGVIGKVA